jgi:ArsR family transcriptional regulator
VCELTDHLDAAQSRLSFHLRVLKEAGLVTDRRWMYYTLNLEVLGEAAESVQMLGTLQPRRESGCC